MREVKHGSTDQSVVIRILDSSDFTPEEAVEHNTGGVALWYRREGATKTAITPAALAALDTAHADGGIEHIDDGYYRLDVPDAAFASGADGVTIGGFFTGMVVIGCYVPLVPARVSADTTAISGDETAADILELFVEALKADSGQIDDGTFANNAIAAAAIAASALNGKGDWNVGKTGYSLAADQSAVTIGVVNAATLANGAHGGAAASLTLADYSNFQGAGGATAEAIYTYFTGESRANAFKATGFSTFNPATDTVARVTLVDTVTANSDKTGYSLTSGTGLGNQTANITGTISTVTNLTNLPAITTDWLTAAGVSAAAVTKIQAGLSTYAGTDTAGTTTLLSRIVGTLAVGTHNPQGGDAHAIVASGTHGNAALKALIDTVDTVADAIKVDTGALNTRLSAELVGRLACIMIGNVADARTAAEKFTYGGVTGTVAADEDGNRTIVFS
jgi:hypothetical protein